MVKEKESGEQSESLLAQSLRAVSWNKHFEELRVLLAWVIQLSRHYRLLQNMKTKPLSSSGKAKQRESNPLTTIGIHSNCSSMVLPGEAHAMAGNKDEADNLDSSRSVSYTRNRS